MPELDWSHAPIHRAIKADWKTPELLIEGSLNCGKTTVGLDKELDALFKWPGIPILLYRWTQDAVDTKLKTAFDELLALRGVVAEWNKNDKCYLFANGSRAYMFGLKAVSQIEMFNKIRGLGVCRIMGDQCEEMDRAVAGELRGRLRPNLTATLTSRSFPFQLTFISNTEDHDFWLSKEFPLDNKIPGRRVYSLSVFDNPFLPQASIDSLVRQFPPDHPKHQTMVLGRRGPNVVGDPVFEGIYDKTLHWRTWDRDPALPLVEAFEFGTHNPTWLWGQPLRDGGLAVLGGIRGEEMVLEDFLCVVKPYRQAWFGTGTVQSCAPPMGAQRGPTAMQRRTPHDTVRAVLPVTLRQREAGNAPDVRLAMIEQLASLMRRGQFVVSTAEDRFLIVNKDGPRESPFVHHACEAGAVWDKHFVSVGNKEVRRVREDDKFANALHALEDILLNFIVGRRSPEEQHADQARIALALSAVRDRTGSRLPFGQGHLA